MPDEHAENCIVDPDAATVDVLALSNQAYASVGTFGRSDHLSSPLLPGPNLPLSPIFPD